MMIIKLVLLGLGSSGSIWVSWASLKGETTHGFFRLFAWESILILLVKNIDVWFFTPWRLEQIISWFFLLISLYLVVEGVRLLKQKGRPDPSRKGSTLIGIEKTTTLVTQGLYGLIRHPLYSSLLFLGWGIYFKDPSLLGTILAVVASFFLTITARMEEFENISYFGDSYRTYMEQTKMFIPFIF